jgi:hypothetical protein
MTMPNADEVAEVRLVELVDWAKRGRTPPTFVRNIVFIVALFYAHCPRQVVMESLQSLAIVMFD